MPLWIPLTESIFRMDVFLLTFVSTIPRSFNLDTTWPLKIHVIFRGWSPLLTAQDIDAISPALAGSSPNSNGNICGGTE